MRSRISSHLAVACLLTFVAITATSSLGRADPLLRWVHSVPGGDVLGHFVLIGSLAFVLVLSFVDRGGPNRTHQWLRIVSGLALLVSLDEALQLFLPLRRFSAIDLAANYLGILVFSTLALVLGGQSQLPGSGLEPGA